MQTCIRKEEDGTISGVDVRAETKEERDELKGVAESYSSRKIKPEPEQTTEPAEEPKEQ